MIENPITYFVLALLVLAFIGYILAKRAGLRPIYEKPINRQVSGFYTVDFKR